MRGAGWSSKVIESLRPPILSWPDWPDQAVTSHWVNLHALWSNIYLWQGLFPFARWICCCHMKTLHTCIDHSGRWPPPACTWYVCLCLIWSRWPSTGGASGLIKYQASGMIAHQDQDQDNQGPAHGNVPNRNSWQMIWNPKPRTKKIKVRSESDVHAHAHFTPKKLAQIIGISKHDFDILSIMLCLWVIRIGKRVKRVGEPD